MVDPVDQYLSRPLNTITKQPIGTAKFKEPVFKRGIFQHDYIEVVVEVYSIVIPNPADNEKNLVAVRFGEMAVVRFVDQKSLYDLKPHRG